MSNEVATTNFAPQKTASPCSSPILPEIDQNIRALRTTLDHQLDLLQVKERVYERNIAILNFLESYADAPKSLRQSYGRKAKKIALEMCNSNDPDLDPTPKQFRGLIIALKQNLLVESFNSKAQQALTNFYQNGSTINAIKPFLESVETDIIPKIAAAIISDPAISQTICDFNPQKPLSRSQKESLIQKTADTITSNLGCHFDKIECYDQIINSDGSKNCAQIEKNTLQVSLDFHNPRMVVSSIFHECLHLYMQEMAKEARAGGWRIHVIIRSSNASFCRLSGAFSRIAQSSK